MVGGRGGWWENVHYDIRPSHLILRGSVLTKVGKTMGKGRATKSNEEGRRGAKRDGEEENKGGMLGDTLENPG